MNKLLSNLAEKTRFFLDDVFAFISAPRCPGCGILLENPRLPVCPGCEAKLTFPGDGPVCLICRSPHGVACNCQANRKDMIPDFYYWATYTQVMRELIHRFKFEGQLKLGEYLTSAALTVLIERLASHKFDSIIPIPMLKRDKHKRTFNQTELISEVVSAGLNTPFNPNILRKVKKTKLQANLGRDERWSNIRGAFSIEDSINLSGASCLLVDDIVTTGATSWEAARTLYAGGVAKVTVLALVSSHFDDVADTIAEEP